MRVDYIQLDSGYTIKRTFMIFFFCFRAMPASSLSLLKDTTHVCLVATVRPVFLSKLTISLWEASGRPELQSPLSHMLGLSCYVRLYFRMRSRVFSWLGQLSDNFHRSYSPLLLVHMSVLCVLKFVWWKHHSQIQGITLDTDINSRHLTRIQFLS